MFGLFSSAVPIHFTTNINRPLWKTVTAGYCEFRYTLCMFILVFIALEVIVE